MSAGVRPLWVSHEWDRAREESKVRDEAWRIWRPRLCHAPCSLPTSELWQRPHPLCVAGVPHS